MSNVAITVIVHGQVNHSEVLEDPEVDDVIRKITSIERKWLGLSGLLFIYDDGKLIQNTPPYSDINKMQIAKMITGYYNYS